MLDSSQYCSTPRIPTIFAILKVSFSEYRTLANLSVSVYTYIASYISNVESKHDINVESKEIIGYYVRTLVT